MVFGGGSGESDDGDNISDLLSPSFSIGSGTGGGGGAKRFWSDSSSWIMSRIGSSSGSGGGSFDKGISRNKGKPVFFIVGHFFAQF